MSGDGESWPLQPPPSPPNPPVPTGNVFPTYKANTLMDSMPPFYNTKDGSVLFGVLVAIGNSDNDIGGLVPPPVIVELDPDSGHVDDTFIIKGFNFDTVTSVRLGGVVLVFTIDSPTQITATVAGDSGDHPLVVTNPGGEFTTSFHVQAS